MPIDDRLPGEVDPDYDPEEAFDELERDYDERRRVIEMFEYITEKTTLDRSRSLMTILQLVMILTILTLLTPALMVLDLAPRGTPGYYVVLYVGPVLAYMIALWALLYVRRTRRSQRFDMETSLSLFQRELGRVWRRNDRLENENRELRADLRLRNYLMHNRHENDGNPHE